MSYSSVVKNIEETYIEMIVDEKRRWMPLEMAGLALTHDLVSVAIGGFVVDASGEMREITAEERRELKDRQYWNAVD